MKRVRIEVARKCNFYHLDKVGVILKNVFRLSQSKTFTCGFTGLSLREHQGRTFKSNMKIIGYEL